MIENLGDVISIVTLILILIYTIIIFYNALVQHREQYFQKREETYYRLFEESEDNEYDERDEPYYED
jgi:uncharacterized protein YxeA